MISYNIQMSFSLPKLEINIDEMKKILKEKINNIDWLKENIDQIKEVMLEIKEKNIKFVVSSPKFVSISLDIVQYLDSVFVSKERINSRLAFAIYLLTKK